LRCGRSAVETHVGSDERDGLATGVSNQEVNLTVLVSLDEVGF
jgi:hypothetical protein